MAVHSSHIRTVFLADYGRYPCNDSSRRNYLGITRDNIETHTGPGVCVSISRRTGRTPCQWHGRCSGPSACTEPEVNGGHRVHRYGYVVRQRHERGIAPPTQATMGRNDTPNRTSRGQIHTARPAGWVDGDDGESDGQQPGRRAGHATRGPVGARSTRRPMIRAQHGVRAFGMLRRHRRYKERCEIMESIFWGAYDGPSSTLQVQGAPS